MKRFAFLWAPKIVVFLLLLLVAMTGVARAQSFSCYEGLGVLENNWQDWSWCSDDLQNTSYLDRGSFSIEVTYSAAWQGFSLNSPASFPSGYFSALMLSINGGPSAGRSIGVYLTVNGQSTHTVSLNKYILGGSVAANKWRVATIPLSAFGLKPTDQISRITLQESSGQAQDPFWIGKIGWLPKGQPKKVSIAVNASTSLRTVDQKMFGVNTAIWDSNFTSATCRGLIQNAGFKAFRYPGGSLSDGYHWSTNTTDSNNWTWATGFDDFASVAVPATGGQCFITVNYGTSTPADAAAWVQYSNVTKGYGFKFWEVGNECYGGWEEDGHTRAHDPVIYATQFAQYYKQMKAIDPTIKVGAVATPGEDGYANYSDEAVTNPRTHQQHSGWTAVMLSTLAGLQVAPDFISYHRYPEYVNDCDFTLLIGNDTWATDIADLRQQLTDYLGSAGAGTQIMCTENNADAGTEGKQLCSLVNGVFMADTFGTILQTECNSFLWWDLINNQNNTGDNGSWLYGWRMYGDEGMFSPDFTQTYPVYYMEQLFNRFAAAGDTVLPTTSSYGLLTAFATKRSDGSVRLMIVNKTEAFVRDCHIAFTGFNPSGAATIYSYGMPQDNAAKHGLPQSIATSTLQNVSNKTALTFAPYSVTVLAFKSNGPVHGRVLTKS